MVHKSAPPNRDAGVMFPPALLRALTVMALIFGPQVLPSSVAGSAAVPSPLGAAPAQAQSVSDVAQSAPRGRITNTLSRPSAIVVLGWATDADAAGPARVLITVDGTRAKVRPAKRPHPLRPNAGFRITVDTTPGIHRVCARIINQGNGRDRSLGCRTVTTRVTAPGNAAGNPSGLGIITTPNGTVMPVEKVNGDGSFDAWTPCANLLRVTGTHRHRARVIVDAGHGGTRETGSVGSNGLVERDLNLVVSERVVQRLERMGISSQLTRTADYRLPLSVRGAIANALDGDLLISVHHNGGAVQRSDEPGTEVWHSTVQDESLRFARILWEEMYNSLKDLDVDWVATRFSGASKRLRTDGNDFFGIHRRTPDIPSVISEYVYLSNPAEAALMASDAMVEREVDAIVRAVVRWYWNTDTSGRVGATLTADASTNSGGSDNCVEPDLGY